MSSTSTFFGWRVVGAAFVLAMFAWGVSFYGPPVFLQALHAGKGWPVTLVSAAITTHFLLGALVVARFAALQQRLGMVAVTRLGAGLTALGLLGWGCAQAPWQLFLAAPISGAGWALTSGAALNAMVSPWFDHRRPAALGMAFNGASMGGVVFTPLWVALIGGLGLPLAAALVAAVLLAVAWLLSGRFLRDSPASLGQRPDGGETPAPARPQNHAPPLLSPWRDRRFLTLAGAATLGLVAQIGLVAHLFSLLVPVMGAAAAGATMGEATGCAILGRAVLGWLMPPGADRRAVAAANVAVQAAGSVLLLAAGPSVPLLLLGCALFGLGLGNVTSLPPLIAQAEFPAAAVPRVVALVTALSQAGYAFAPAGFGLLRELSGAPALFAVAAAVQFAAAALVLAGRRD